MNQHRHAQPAPWATGQHNAQQWSTQQQWGQPMPPPMPAQRPRRTAVWGSLGLSALAVVVLIAGGGGFGVLLAVAALAVAVRALSGAASGTVGVAALALILAVLVGAIGAISLIPSPSSTGSTATAAPAVSTPPTAVTEAEWNRIARDPSAHAGQRVLVHGVVMQADANTGAGTVLALLGATKMDSWNYPTTVMLHGSALDDYASGDTFSAGIEIDGATEYDTLIGGSNNAVEATLISITPES